MAATSRLPEIKATRPRETAGDRESCETRDNPRTMDAAASEIEDGSSVGEWMLTVSADKGDPKRTKMAERASSSQEAERWQTV